MSAVLTVEDKFVRPYLDEIAVRESSDDIVEILYEKGEELGVGNVPCTDNEQPAGRTAQQVAIAEVPVLGDEHPIVRVRQRRKDRIGCAVAFREGGGMECVVPFSRKA